MIIDTGLEKFNAILGGGLRPSSLVVLGGRPGMGKTSFLITLAAQLIERNIKFLFVSLEFKEEYTLRQILRNMAAIPFCIPDDELSGIEYQRIVWGHNMMQKTEAFFTSERYFEKVKEEISALPEEVKIVFIDYLQLFLMPPGYEETSKAIIELKNLCHEKDICIVVASQLSRKVEERQGHRPRLTDYRDSGAIEETADQCLFLIRRDYYDPMDRPGFAEIILEKNRFGKCGSCYSHFIPEMGLFKDFNPVIKF